MIFLLLALPLIYADDCKNCVSISDKFNVQLHKTRKANFGGGNTHWEEQKLGSYLNSAVRLQEILENLYTQEDVKSSRLATFMETHEEKIEEWWANKNTNKTIFEYLCIEELKLCCNKGHWGPDCNKCSFKPNSTIPCSGNGFCQGDGTRRGDGVCKCDIHAFGTLCDKCERGYYLSNINSTHSKCLACDQSCLNNCSDDSPSTCDSCANGFYLLNDTCHDVDECSKEELLCSNNQYCKNTYGSYTCQDCDPSCQGCLSEAINCNECSPGYRFNNTAAIHNQDDNKFNQCFDIDECSEGTHSCEVEEVCSNIPGHYSCDKLTEEDISNETKDEL